MKKFNLIIILAFISFFTATASAQAVSKQPSAELRLKQIELANLLVKVSEIELLQLKQQRNNLRQRYTDAYEPLVQLNRQVEAKEQELKNLKIREIKEKEDFEKNLPNNQIQLMKLLVIQNQKIIELLRESK